MMHSGRGNKCTISKPLYFTTYVLLTAAFQPLSLIHKAKKKKGRIYNYSTYHAHPYIWPIKFYLNKLIWSNQSEFISSQSLRVSLEKGSHGNKYRPSKNKIEQYIYNYSDLPASS